MSYLTILQIIESFYAQAKKDVMIGYHFRFIENFESHIPRIADFWNLQINGSLEDRRNLPFRLIETHSGIGIKRGEMGRWITLFIANLEEFLIDERITQNEYEIFEAKVAHFRSKIEEKIFS